MLRHRLVCALLWASVTTSSWAQVAPTETTPVTVGDLMTRVRERCETGRAQLGPFQMKEVVERPTAADQTPLTAVLLVMDDKVLAILSGGAITGIVKILDDGDAVYCNPIGAMADEEARNTLVRLTFPFDCDQLADPLGLGPDAPVVMEESEGATYYRVDPPQNVVRWIDAEDLTLAEEWVGDDDLAIRDVYNNWVPMGGSAWYPELTEQWTNDVVTTRLTIEYLFPAPDLSPGVFTRENFYSTATFDDMMNDDGSESGDDDDYEESGG
jgi:hypothetical protein